MAVMLTAATVGYLIWNKPHKNVLEADAAKISAAELYNSFINDSAKARSLYVDKVVQVSGEAAKVSLNQQAQQIIFITTPVSGAFINCTMEKKINGIRQGDKVTLKGICSGYISGDADMGLPGDVFILRGYPADHK